MIDSKGNIVNSKTGEIICKVTNIYPNDKCECKTIHNHYHTHEVKEIQEMVDKAVGKAFGKIMGKDMALKTTNKELTARELSQKLGVNLVDLIQAINKIRMEKAGIKYD